MLHKIGIFISFFHCPLHFDYGLASSDHKPDTQHEELKEDTKIRIDLNNLGNFANLLLNCFKLPELMDFK